MTGFHVFLSDQPNVFHVVTTVSRKIPQTCRLSQTFLHFAIVSLAVAARGHQHVAHGPGVAHRPVLFLEQACAVSQI